MDRSPITLPLLLVPCLLMLFCCGCADDAVVDSDPPAGGDADVALDEPGEGGTPDQESTTEEGSDTDSDAGHSDEHAYVVVDDTNFEEVVLKSDKPVLVDFWAAWCGPCRIIAPTVEELAKDYKGKFVVAKLDVDESPATSAKYQVSAIPYLVFFKGGEQMDAIKGVVDKADIEEKMQGLLQPAP